MDYQIRMTEPVRWRADRRVSEVPRAADTAGAAAFLAQWGQIRAAVAEALRPYPEALAAVVESQCGLVDSVA